MSVCLHAEDDRQDTSISAGSYSVRRRRRRKTPQIGRLHIGANVGDLAQNRCMAQCSTQPVDAVLDYADVNGTGLKP